MRRILAPLAALWAVIVLVPSISLGATHDVAVRDARFEPAVLQAAAGDTVTWTWFGSLQHNVVAYSGASFRSNTQRMGTFSASFPGGTVLYRCTLHSTIDQGPCNGMCGILSDDATPPAAPSITAPTEGALLASPVRIEGTAPGAATVLVREGTAVRGEAVVDQDGSWFIELSFTDGAHSVNAIARSSIGIASAPSAPVSFTVDAVAPTITMGSPGDLSITGDPIAASGTASDDRGLAVVRVVLVNLLLGSESVTVATVAEDGTWTAAVEAPHPGPFSIYATARDHTGNEATTPPATIIVGLPD